MSSPHLLILACGLVAPSVALDVTPSASFPLAFDVNGIPSSSYRVRWQREDGGGLTLEQRVEGPAATLLRNTPGHAYAIDLLDASGAVIDSATAVAGTTGVPAFDAAVPFGAAVGNSTAGVIVFDRCNLDGSLVGVESLTGEVVWQLALDSVEDCEVGRGDLVYAQLADGTFDILTLVPVAVNDDGTSFATLER